jgi:hypothetical protein
MRYHTYSITEIREELTNGQVLSIIPNFNDIHSDGAERRVFIIAKIRDNYGHWDVLVDDPSDGDIKEFIFGLLPTNIQDLIVNIVRKYSDETGIEVRRGMLINGINQSYDEVL